MKFIFNLLLCFSVLIPSLSLSSEGVVENNEVSIPDSSKNSQDITTADTVISCDISSTTSSESKTLEKVIALYNSERYELFIRTVVQKREVWGLYHDYDGWALAISTEDDELFPLWPTKEYAQLCADKVWSDYQPKSLSLEEFMQELLPHLKKNGLKPGIFYTPDNQVAITTVYRLLACLNLELEWMNYFPL